MKRFARLLTMLAITVLSQAARSQTAIGDWWTSVETAPGQRFRYALHIAAGADGKLGGRMDILGLSFSSALADVTLSGDRLSFGCAGYPGHFEGTWDAAATAWRGHWIVDGKSAEMVLAAGKPPASTRPALGEIGRLLTDWVAPPADWRVPDDAAIRKVIADHIAPRPGVGMAVGVLEPKGRRVVTGGPVKPDTLFEIGSVSKVFTAMILADMAAKGEVSLDDPAEKYLPAGARLPERGRKITLRDLSMHRSGLPRVPDNMRFADVQDPVADYTEAAMLEFLGRYQLPRDAGAKWEYSNLGVGLLGYLLGRAAHKPYAELLREHITGPLGMKDTGVAPSPGQMARLAIPHDMYGKRTKPWTAGAFVAAGGIKSTAPDMLKFAAAVIDPKSPLAPGMKLALRELGDQPLPRSQQALGWWLFQLEPQHRLLVHSGATGGFQACLAIEPSRRTAAVALIDTVADNEPCDVILHVLLGSPASASSR